MKSNFAFPRFVASLIRLTCSLEPLRDSSELIQQSLIYWLYLKRGNFFVGSQGFASPSVRTDRGQHAASI